MHRTVSKEPPSEEVKIQFKTRPVQSEHGAQLVPVVIHELPLDRPINLRLSVFFHQSSNWVDVEAEIPRAKGLELRQLRDDFVFAQVLHGEESIEEQCTVRCPKTGASRKGKNVCIECSSGSGTVKVCC